MAIVTSVEAFPDALIYTASGFTADAESATEIFALDYGFMINGLLATVARTAGSTVAVQVDIKRRIAGASVQDDALTITDSGGTYEEVLNKPGSTWQIVVDTVGSGNTLTVTVILSRRSPST